jgi:NDP-sugar pyrophosphorylase family protein
MRNKISITISENLLHDIDSIIDNIYIRNRSQAIEYLCRNSLGESKTAVILAGGKEEHLKLGKDYRMTAKIDDSSVIEKAIIKLRKNGFKNIFIISRKKALTKIFEILRDGSQYGINLEYIEEKESKGTFDSLKLLKGKLKTSFLVVYGDIIFDKIKIEELWNDHIKNNSTATIMLTTSSKPSEKGTVTVEGSKVLRFTQKPKTSDIYLVFSPIFAADLEILEHKGHSLETDVFPLLAEKNLLDGHLSSEKEKHVHSKDDLK